MELTALGCSLTLPSCCKAGRTLEGFKFQEPHLVKERKKERNALAFIQAQHPGGKSS